MGHKSLLKGALFLFMTPLFAVLPAFHAGAAVLRVPEEFKTITDGVNSAQPGDTVIVGKGDYRDNIVIRKALTLKSGKGPGVTIITAANKGEPVIKIEGASEVEVSGFALTGSDVSGITLVKASRCRITANKAGGNASGILLYSSDRNTISGNAADKNDHYGIYIEKSHFNSVSNNTANANGDKGVFLSSSNNNTVTDNNANLNTWNGIVLWSSHRNILRENKALRNTYGMVLSESDDTEEEGNSTWPNFFIILPIILIYLGIVNYLVQKNIFRVIYKV